MDDTAVVPKLVILCVCERTPTPTPTPQPFCKMAYVEFDTHILQMGALLEQKTTVRKREEMGFDFE